MKKSTTASRLKEYMSAHNLRQVDILTMVEPFCKETGIKMNKSDLSQYVSGKTEPGQDKLYVLARALGVSEIWLMGYDDEIVNNSPLFTLRYGYNQNVDLNELAAKDDRIKIIGAYLQDADDDSVLQIMADLGVQISAVRPGEVIYKKLSKQQRMTFQDFLFKNENFEKELELLQNYLKLNLDGEIALIGFLDYLANTNKYTE